MTAGEGSACQSLTSKGTCPMKSFHSLCLSLLPILWPHGRAGMALLGPSPILPKLCTAQLALPLLCQSSAQHIPLHDFAQPCRPAVITYSG